MGLNLKLLQYIIRVGHNLDVDIMQSRICLLGNLYLGMGMGLLRKKYGTKVAHLYLTKLGAEVVSIDINGKNGALALDLQEPLPTSLGKFDVIINGGTTEHIANQYAVFKNVHDLCRVGALMFHYVPAVGHWLLHGFYGYPDTYFIDLAELCNYSIIATDRDDYVSNLKEKERDLVFACLQKKSESVFPTQEEFTDLSETLERKGKMKWQKDSS